MRITWTTIIGILVLTFAQAQGTELALRLQKGKAYKQVSNSTVIIDQDINGEKVNLEMMVKSSLSFMVKSIRGNSYNMEVVYESLGLDMKLPQVSMSFDSEKNDEQDIFSTILSEMKNRPFKVKMSKQGKIEEVEEMESIFEAAFQKFSQLPEAKLAQMKGQLIKAFGEESFVGNSQMITAIFPQNAVALGDTWSIDTDFKSGMSARVSSSYTLEKVTRKEIFISGNSKIVSTDKDTYFESNGVSLKYDLTGTMGSEIKIDKSTGWVIEATIGQDIAGDSFIEESLLMPDGMKIPMSMKNKMVITGDK